MPSNEDTKTGKIIGGVVSAVIIMGTIVLGLIVLEQTHRHPRTDDCEISANFIGIAPQVEGPILRLNVHDNQFVKKGDLLYEIDERPYEYALETAISEQAALEGQISDESRRIAALVSAVSVSQANIQQRRHYPTGRSYRPPCRSCERGTRRQPGAGRVDLRKQQSASPGAATHRTIRDR